MPQSAAQAVLSLSRAAVRSALPGALPGALAQASARSVISVATPYTALFTSSLLVKACV